MVANAVAALSEIGDTSGRDVMEIDTSVLQKLLAALNECTEWGQVRERLGRWREHTIAPVSLPQRTMAGALGTAALGTAALFKGTRSCVSPVLYCT